MTDMTGKTVMITGASKGIGAAAAREFAAHGANVVLLARSGDALQALADEIGPQALPIECDVADFVALETAVARSVAQFGSLDVMINNAGVITPIGRIEDVAAEAWSTMIDINLKGVFHGMKAVLSVMAAQGGGTVLTVSSGAAHGPMEGWSHYCSSKAGAAMLTRCLDMETRDQGIRAMGLSPGTVATERQVLIKESGINPVSQLDPSVHIPAEWPAKCLGWRCGPEADAYIGQELSLRDEDLRAKLGLTG
jgi:NAD(P)-dependent dehydrogenase (short-subunit alcohol dehydrogenase family)